jgi:anti-sigma B factor antagonist
MDFNIESKVIEKEYAVVTLQGEVDAFTAPKLKQELIAQMERGIVRLAINLEEVSYLDSTGLGALISGMRRTREKNGALVLICPNDRIARIFDITGLSRIFENYLTEEDALKRLRGEAKA